MYKRQISDRSTAIKGVESHVSSIAQQAKDAHKQTIADLDKEAQEVIASIVQGNKDQIELTDFIPGLGKDWFNISWNE